MSANIGHEMRTSEVDLKFCCQLYVGVGWRGAAATTFLRCYIIHCANVLFESTFHYSEASSAAVAAAAAA